MKPVLYNFSPFSFKSLRFLMALLLLICGRETMAQLPYSQTFRNSSAADVQLGGTGTLTAGNVDPEGAGYLRLTSNLRSQAGFARSSTSFSSAQGFSISFEYYTYGGHGDADGMVFFLYDATANPFNIGDLGGSLGYAPNTGVDGLSKAYIGFGFDEFGNFSASHLSGPGPRPNSLTLRGDGNGGLNPGVSYKYLKSIKTDDPDEMTSAGAGSVFKIAGRVDGRDTGPDGLKPSNVGYRKALIKMAPNTAADGFIINVWLTEGSSEGGILHHVIKNYAYKGSSLPQNLSYGFAGSTGDQTNYHEIRNLTIDLPEELNSIVVASVNKEGNENDDITFNSSDFISKFSSLKNTSLTKVKVVNLPADGKLLLDGISVTAGQEIPVNVLNHLTFRPDAGFSGLTSFSWNGSDGSIYSDNSSVVNLKYIAIPAKFPYAETFTKSLAKGVVYGGSPAATLTAGNLDAEGNGFLRLTNNAKNQLGFARSKAAFPSENGFSISFDYFSYGGSGADGISFFLFDATASPFNIGEPGGSLGYAGGNHTAGVSKAYIGFGLDEFGNFSSSASGGPGQMPSSVTVRGKGNGTMGVAGNYSYLTGIQTTDAVAMSAAGSGSAFNISGGIDGRNITSSSAGYRNAKIEMVPNGPATGYIINVWITEGSAAGEIKHHVIKNYAYTGVTPPSHLSYGFAASSGDYTNYHEIRNLTMVVPSSVILKSSVTEISKSTKEDQPVYFNLDDFTSNFYDPYAFNTLTKVMFTALPAVSQGTLKLDGVNIQANQQISVADIAASKLSFAPAANFNGITAGIKWTGFNGAESAPVSADVNLEVLSVNDAPSGADKTITLVTNDNHTFNAADFGFSDSSDIVPNNFKSIVITTVPAAGTLKLDNVTVNAGTEIASESINLLSFIPAAGGKGLPYASFTFQVRDNGGVLHSGQDLDPSANTITLNVVEVPSVTITNPTLAICVKSSSATFNYEGLSGNLLPDVYSIDWSSSANQAGMTDVSDISFTGGDIVVGNLSNIPLGTYTGAITVRNSANTYISAGKNITLMIIPSLTAAISYASDVFCASGKAQAIVTGDKGGVFTSASGLSLNALTGEIDLGKSIPGTYTVNYTLSNQSCSATTIYSLSINAVPVVPVIIGETQLYVGSTTQLMTSLSGGTWESYNTEYATISPTGLVKGLKAGTAAIVYTIKNGSCSSSVAATLAVKELVENATKNDVKDIVKPEVKETELQQETIVIVKPEPGKEMVKPEGSNSGSTPEPVKNIQNQAPVQETVKPETVKSSNAQLSSIALSAGSLSPVFNTNTFSYFSSVANGASSISINPGAEVNASVRINGTAASTGSAFNPIDLAVGENKVSIEVTAADGITTKTYTIFINRAAPLMPYSETFKNITTARLVFGGSPNTARLTGGNTDAPGAGYLRLTSNQKENSAHAYSTTSFPSNKGYSISFEYFMYGGSGGEGMTFFLFDAAANQTFNAGAAAGSLGYAQRSDISAPGVSKGFLALALDQAGNFSNPFQGRQGGPGIRNSAVVLRGDGNGTGAGAPAGTNYEYLTGIQTGNAAAMLGLGKPFQIAGGQEGRTAPGGSLDPSEAGYRKVRMDMEPNAAGSGFKINVYITENTDGMLTTHHLIKNYFYTPTNGVPANLSYGFSASTGGTNNFHEVRNLEISALDGTTVPDITVSHDQDKPVVLTPPVITIPDLANPNATNLISPNGDGINDKWIIRNLEKYPNNVVRIFDRGGRMVFMKENYNNDWEGTFNGNVLEIGTYYYVADFGPDAKTIKGYISIVK